LASRTSSFPILVLPVSALQCRLSIIYAALLGNPVNGKKPILWGVNWYSIPGFPNPTISFTAATSSPEALFQFSALFGLLLCPS